MTSSRPYLLRAFYEWIVDNQLTPYVMVNTDFPGVLVPKEHVDNGRIVLNLAPEAVCDLSLTNETVMFDARFGGKSFEIYIPLQAIEAIYAKENGRGMVFKDEEDPPPFKGKTRGKPNLTIVK